MLCREHCTHLNGPRRSLILCCGAILAGSGREIGRWEGRGERRDRCVSNAPARESRAEQRAPRQERGWWSGSCCERWWRGSWCGPSRARRRVPAEHSHAAHHRSHGAQAPQGGREREASVAVVQAEASLRIEHRGGGANVWPQFLQKKKRPLTRSKNTWWPEASCRRNSRARVRMLNSVMERRSSRLRGRKPTTDTQPSPHKTDTGPSSALPGARRASVVTSPHGLPRTHSASSVGAPRSMTRHPSNTSLKTPADKAADKGAEHTDGGGAPSEAIRIYVRVRSSDEPSPCLHLAEDGSILHRDLEGAPPSRFWFDDVGTPKTSQQDIFDAVGKPVAEATLAGVPPYPPLPPPYSP